MITRRRRTPDPQLPVSLPHVIAVAGTDGRFSITIDGHDHEQSTPHRAELADAVTAIAQSLASPVRVEIREQDGSHFTDIIAPPVGTPERQNPAVEAEPSEGFLPGEQISVAVVVASRIADNEGTAGVTLPPGLTAQMREVVLMGQTSGTVVVVGGTA